MRGRVLIDVHGFDWCLMNRYLQSFRKREHIHLELITVARDIKQLLGVAEWDGPQASLCIFQTESATNKHDPSRHLVTEPAPERDGRGREVPTTHNQMVGPIHPFIVKIADVRRLMLSVSIDGDDASRPRVRFDDMTDPGL